MFAALWAVIAPTLAAVLAVSAVAKLRSPGSVDRSFRDLEVPPALARPWMRRVSPWGELAVAALLLVTASWFAVAAAALSLALFVAYLVLVARALSRPVPVSCGCFGESSTQPVDRWTLVRNIALVAVAALGVVALLVSPDASSAIWPLLAVEHAPAVIGGAIVAIVLLALGRNGDVNGATSTNDRPDVPLTTATPATPSLDTSADDELEPYLRELVPPHVVQLPDGRILSLRQRAAEGAYFLLYAAEGCGGCKVVLSNLDRLRRAVAPLDLVVINPVGTHPEHAAASGYGVDLGDGMPVALNFASRPWGAMIGADGLFAGGPAEGPEAIFELGDDIRTELDAAGLTADLTIDDYVEHLQHGSSVTG